MVSIFTLSQFRILSVRVFMIQGEQAQRVFQSRSPPRPKTSNPQRKAGFLPVTAHTRVTVHTVMLLYNFN